MVRTGAVWVRIIAIAAVAAMLMPLQASVSEQDPNSSFDVTDDHGNTVHFSGPVDHIISIGVGLTASVIQLEAGDKIVVSDMYSYKNQQPVFDKLRQLVAEHRATAGGTIYNTGVDQLKNEVIDAADGGNYDKGRDVIIVTGQDTYLIDNGLVQFFKDKGFRVLAWRDVVDYDRVIGLLSDISRIVTGSVSSKVTDMKKTEDYIRDTLRQHGVTEKREAFYVTYSGDAFKVGNTGSLATSMLLAAGGDGITIDPSIPSPTYECNLTDLIQKHGTDVVVFADNSIASSPTAADKLRQQVGSDVLIVPLDPLWNNFCLESLDGVWVMACAMYPDYFQGDVPSFDGDSGGSVLYYGLAGIAGAVLVVAASMYIMRKD